MSLKLRRILGVVVSAGLLTMMLSALTGCMSLEDEKAPSYKSGETVTFANGYAVLIPRGWSGEIDPDTMDFFDPAGSYLDLYGSLDQEALLYLIDSSKETSRMIAQEREWITRGDEAGRMGLAYYNDVRVDMVILKEGKQDYNLLLYIWAKDRNLFVQLYGSSSVNKAVKKGVDDDELAKIAIEEIGLQFPSE